MFYYFACGLKILSEINLPELVPHKPAKSFNVHIKKGRVQEKFPPSKKAADHFRITPKKAFFYWKNESKILVKNGREIIADIFPNADEKALRLSILGPAFSQLLTQRGYLVLHASAVKIKGGAVAFLGASSSGKSTLAAKFYSRKYPLVTDNLLVVRFEKGKVLAVPSFPQVKLWPDSAKNLGWNIRTLPSIDAVTSKRALRLKSDFVKKPLPIKRIYLLAKGRSIEIVDAKPSEKIFHLINHSFGAHTYGQNNKLSPHFFQCARLIKKVPMSFLKRGRDLSSLPAITQAVKEDLSSR